VLLDTLLVRTILVPASFLTIGERIWWPARARTDGRGAELPPGADKGNAIHGDGHHRHRA
jgi:uncharacterized membrane protein YdfJ with MMPL/SSD domain